MVNLSFRLDV